MFGRKFQIYRSIVSSANREQKDWFRGIIGTEIQSMDNTTRKNLLLDSTYGKLFIDAIAIAEAKRNKQLESVAAAFTSGTNSTIDIWDVAIDTAMDRAQGGLISDFNVRIVKGERFVEWFSPSGTVYVTGKTDYGLMGAHFSQEKLADMLKNGRVLVYLCPPKNCNAQG